MGCTLNVMYNMPQAQHTHFLVGACRTRSKYSNRAVKFYVLNTEPNSLRHGPLTPKIVRMFSALKHVNWLVPSLIDLSILILY